MSKNATKRNDGENGETVPTAILTELQSRAIQLLLQGESISDVATAVGRDRATLYRWLHQPKFIAERNRLAKETYDASRARLHNLARRAIDVVERRVDSGDLKAALAVLRMTGLATAEKFDDETDEGRLIARIANELAESYWGNFLMGEKRKNLHNTPRFVELLHEFFLELDHKYQTGNSEAFQLHEEIAQRELAAAEGRRNIVRRIENSARAATLPRMPKTAVSGKNS